ncbi:MAG: hypothetical protein OXI34_06980 [Chloroflexota bacterium]|nr:hypothetical protein [Chloroflexota bacterium]MDE2946356.1 hypothetical protein [Chloroflexota bacterium]
MELLQNIDPAHIPAIAVGCALLCVVFVVIGFVLQAASGLFDLMMGLIEIVAEIVQGGPAAWCGCALLIAIGLACAGFAFLFLNAPETCAANPTRFCQWFGFIP